MTCLLCDLPAVADLLCVPCGAKLWAAEMIALLDVAAQAPKEWQEARAKALQELGGPAGARLFLLLHSIARSNHVAKSQGCVECGELVPRDDHKPTCSWFPL
jgi:hypothetical protein